MKKTIILVALAINGISIAQTWNLNGNSGTNPTTDYLGTSDNQDLVLKTSSKERVRINSTGQIGIGAAPNSNLAINLRGSTEFVSESTGDGFHFFSDAQNIVKDGDIMWLSHNHYQGNEVGILTLSSPSSPTDWSTPKFSVRASGKVLIGVNWNNMALASCSDCNDYKLFVRGGIRTEKVKVDVAAANGWADYVFEKEYKLMPLTELEKFIKENKHLPEVPSTDQAIKEGIELKEMNILLLKKVEELTLYVIQQQKEIQELKNTVKKDEK
ncbi:hypothetical protein GCM10023210_12240 [Chryseobacterium ginsengisoli]|uniref:Cell wall anchor protein n=1 Tax=Chryseobacterium ginsengisoli TaxID=363853 RepID=A0ABP9M284_9FLAO